MGVSFDGTTKESNFIGVVNFNHHRKKCKSCNKYMRNHLDVGGGIVYIYSRWDKEQGLESFEKLRETELKSIYNTGKSIFICKDDYLKENKLDVDSFLNVIKDGIDRLNKSGCKKNWVYLNMNELWNYIEEVELQYMYHRFKKISQSRGVKFIFRYIMKHIKLDYNNTLLMNHEVLFIEKENDFEIYTPANLINQSLFKLLEKSFKDERHGEELKEVEHLKALGDIMEGAVHDINNLLATIAGYVQLSLATAQSSEVTDYLEIIKKTALDGRNAIDNIKSYIRGYSSGKKAYYNFDSIVNNCIMMARYKFKSSYLRDRKELGIDISLNSRAFIYGNEYEIRQSILNIILNGIDAMEYSGTLTIKTYDHNRQVMIEISDTGTGIDKENMDKIFDPYFTTKESNGTGLGLNIVRNMVENHNGQIYVESQLGKGTKFTLSFPIARYKMSEVTDMDKYSKNA